MLSKIKLIKRTLKSYGFLFSLKAFLRAVECFFRRNFLFQEYIVRKVNDMYFMKVNLKKAGQHKVLRLFRTWEELETEIIKQFVKKGMNVLDLGAGVGYYSLLFANLTGEPERVYSVEPLPENFALLEENIALNCLENRLCPDNIAISSKSGFMDFFIGMVDNVGTLAEVEKHKQTGKSIKAKTVSFVDYLKDKPRIDFMRMDIERGEIDIFNDLMLNGSKLTQGLPKRIFFEIHPIGDEDPDPTYTPCLDWFSDIGYFAEYVIASSNQLAMEKFKSLGYTPQKITSHGHVLFRDIKAGDLMEIAARRPKITRAILLTFKNN